MMTVPSVLVVQLHVLNAHVQEAENTGSEKWDVRGLACVPCDCNRANKMVLPGSSGPEGTQRPPQTARNPPKPKRKTTRETCAAPQTAPTRSFASVADAQHRCQMASLQQPTGYSVGNDAALEAVEVPVTNSLISSTCNLRVTTKTYRTAFQVGTSYNLAPRHLYMLTFLLCLCLLICS